MGLFTKFITSPVTILLVFASAGLSVWKLEQDPATSANTYVLLFSATAAWIALLYNAGSAQIQSRKQHTITTLFQTRMSATYHEKLDDFFNVFPEGIPITVNEFENAKNTPNQKKSVDALKFLLNYYEFLAVGIKRKDLDETLLRETIRGILCNIVEQCAQIIKLYREENPNIGSMRRWENLVKLYGQWKDPTTKTDLGQGRWHWWARFRFFLARAISPTI